MDKMGFPKNTSVYFVYTPLCASMEKEYSGAYNDGNLGNIYSQFSKAATELAPELQKKKTATSILKTSSAMTGIQVISSTMHTPKIKTAMTTTAE